jgi:hypothetical protein
MRCGGCRCSSRANQALSDSGKDVNEVLMMIQDFSGHVGSERCRAVTIRTMLG